MSDMSKKGNKDPAFLWYPNDYIGGTMGMTFEEKGAYVDLLMMQFNRGHMTSHMVGQVLGQNMDKLWSSIKTKFIIDENGLFYNERLEQEIQRRKGFISSRHNNLKGNNQYKKSGVVVDEESGHMGGHMTSHMENENENNNNIDIDRGMGEDFINEDYYDYLKKFNEYPFKQIRSISDNRAKYLNEILCIGGEKLFDDILTKAKASSYLTGQKNGQKATFDWLCRKDNWMKILEGFYDDNKPVGKKEEEKVDYSKIEAEQNKIKRDQYIKNSVKPSEVDSITNGLSNLKRFIK